MNLFRLIPFLLFLQAAACAPTLPPPAVPEARAGLRLYLQPLPQEAAPVVFRVASIAARREDGSDLPLSENPLKMHGAGLVGRQKLLLAAALPPGVYQGLVLHLESAARRADAGEIPLTVAAAPLLVPHTFTIDDDRALALFLSLSAERLVSGTRFTPTFFLRGPSPALPSLKGFAANTATGTVSVFEKKTPAVTAVLAVGREPRELALDPRRFRLYAALGGDDAIAVIDALNESVQARIRLRPGDEPVELALSPNGRTLVSANRGTRSVSIIDAVSLYERERILLPAAPASVFFDRSGERAFVLQESNSTLAAIDLRRAQVSASVRLEESPLRGRVSADGRDLYLLSADSADLLVLDAASLALKDRKYVGPGARCLAVDGSDGLIYVGGVSGEVAVLEPGLDLPIESFPVSGAVSYLAVDREENSVFAVVGARGRIEKYDLVSKKFLGELEVDAGTYAVSVMGEE